MGEVVVRAAVAATPLYPLGGGTALSFGLPARKSGWGLSTANLNRVVDYPARDMTITVEAGITMAALAAELSANGQRLPVDVPQASEATLGGAIATASSGPRRFGHGTMRDFVIGISAIDGRGIPFKAGGRVVKNVAGYDFCKLLTGSRGQLAMITQVTLKLRPLAEATAFVVCDLDTLDRAEQLLAALVTSATTPAAVELLAGPVWTRDLVLGPASGPVAARLVVGLEGTPSEVDWMTAQLSREWRDQGATQTRIINGAAADSVWSRLVEFPISGEPALVVKANLLASVVTRFFQTVTNLDANCSIQAHAGSGVVYVQFPEFSAADALRVLIAGLQPAAVLAGGHAIVYAAPPGLELTHQAVWGPMGPAANMMRAVKKQVDPQGLFNPGLAIFPC